VTSLDTIIIGAGISGLVAAHRLKRMGRHVASIERGDRAGGVIHSLQAEEFLIEQGPNSLRGTHELLDLVEELKLDGELVAADPRAPAYLYADGELHAVPMSPPALAKTKLLSNAAKLRLLGEPFIKTRGGGGDESIASFVRRRLGGEILEKLVAPFLSGVYAGDPELLSVQACFPRLAEFEAETGSIARGAIRAARSARKQADKPKRSLRQYRLCSFRNGLSTLTRSLATSLGESLLTEARVRSIDRASQFEVAVERAGKTEMLRASSLIVAAPADAAAKLLHSIAPEIAALVAEIPYNSIASVPLAYKLEQASRALDGFGFLAPRAEGLRTLGSIWNSSLFAGRAPQGWILTTNFIGGATDADAVSLSDEDLIRTVHHDLKKVLGIAGEPRRLPIARYQRAIPQYNLGHAARVEAIEAALRNHQGLWLAGNYLRGISLGDCIRNAGQTAIEVEDFLK
jgi:oxygen-dependent protoporphyrinogen oxidase